MNLLQLAQEFCRRQGLPIPTAVVSSPDDTTQQVLGLMNEGMQDLVDRYTFEGQRQVASFVYNIASPDFTALVFRTKLPDFKYMVHRTFWEATSRLPVLGPLTPEEWRFTVTMLVAPARYSYRIYGGAIHVFPLATKTQNFVFEYASKNGVRLTDGTGTETWTTDDSYSILPDNVVLMDLKWRWLKQKSLPYAEDQRTSEEAIVNLLGREPGRELLMHEGELTATVGPGLLVAAGSWPLP